MLRHASSNEISCVTAVHPPPGDREEVLTTIASHQCECARNFFVGDLNFDACDPRTAAEEALAFRFDAWISKNGAARLPPVGITRRL